MAKRYHISLSRFLFELGSRVQYKADPVGSFIAEEKAPSALASRILPYKKKMKNALSKAVEQSFILSLKRKGIAYLFSTRIRSFGILFFSCGFLQLLFYFLSNSVSFLPTGEDRLVFGVAQMFLTLLATFSRGDLADGVKRSFLFRRLLSPLCGLREWDIPSEKSHDSVGGMLLAGVLLGLAGAFFSPVVLLGIVFFLALVLFLFAFPEAGLLLSLLAALFLPKSFLILVTLTTLVSFLCKCAVGKRSMAFSPMDLAVFLFLFPFLFVGANAGFLMFLTLFSLYYLTSCLIRNLASIHRLFSAFTAFSLAGSALLTAGRLLEIFVPSLPSRFPYLDLIFFVEYRGETGALLAMLAPLILADMKGASGFGKKLWCLTSFATVLCGLAAVGNPAVWLAALLGILLFLLFTYRSALILILGTALAAVTVLNVLPSDYVTTLAVFFGFGREGGEESGMIAQSFLQFLFREGGLFWPVAFFVILGLFIRRVIGFSSASFEGIHPKVFATLSSAAVLFAVSVQEMMIDLRVVALFVLLAAVPGAALRAARREAVKLPY